MPPRVGMKYAFIVLGILLLVYLVIDYNGRTAEQIRLSAEREVVRAQLESREQTKAALEAQIAYATSDAAVLKWGYENHMIRPGDIPVVPVGAGQFTPTPQVTPIATTTQVSNFESWVWLFVGP